MSEQREVEIGANVQLSPEQIQKKRARIAEVLERGYINHKLDLSFLPRNMVGQWVRNDPNEITGLEMLDYQVYHGENTPDIHGSGDGTVRVGDVILMVTDKDTADLIAQEQQARIERIHNPKPEQAEESNFRSNIKSIDAEDIKPIVTSRVEEIGGLEIENALRPS